MVAQSVTNKQIARYWNQRRRLEEDHLFAAVKAAARLRARNLSVTLTLSLSHTLSNYLNYLSLALILGSLSVISQN